MHDGEVKSSSVFNYETTLLPPLTSILINSASHGVWSVFRLFTGGRSRTARLKRVYFFINKNHNVIIFFNIFDTFQSLHFLHTYREVFTQD